MEKDNKKARDDGRREYNDTVRVRGVPDPPISSSHSPSFSPSPNSCESATHATKPSNKLKPMPTPTPPAPTSQTQTQTSFNMFPENQNLIKSNQIRGDSTPNATVDARTSWMTKAFMDAGTDMSGRCWSRLRMFEHSGG